MARGIANKSLISFNAGELSPKLDARTDIEKYGNGCRILKNAIPEPYGAASRRPGTQYIASTKDHDTKAALVGFKFSTTTNFVLEFGVEYIRFYSNGAQVEVTGTPVEVVTPYAEADLFELQVTQINDVVYVCHPDYPVYKLSRISDTSWTFEVVVFDYPVLLDENLDEAETLALSGTTLTASSARFQASHVGSYWQLAHLRESAFVELQIIVPDDWVTATAYVIGDIRRANSINWRCIVAHTSGVFNTDEAAGKWTASEADRTSDTIPVRGKWNVRTYGVWSANIRVDRSLDGGTTWTTVRRFSGREDRNLDAEGEQGDESIFRIVLDEIVAPGTAGATTPRVVLEVVDAYVYGLVKVTAFTSSTQVTVEVIDTALSTEATAFWSEGAWSDVRGYPRAVTLHEQRLCFGGTAHKPQTVWGSVTDDFENFARGTLDTDSFAYTLGGTQYNAILWFVSQGRLLIGTTAGEWSMWSGDQGLPITPSSVKIDRQSAFGSKPGVPAMLVNDVVLFVQKQGLKVRELTFSLEKDGYVAPDLTVLSEHITASGIVQMAYQAQSNAILWAVTANGVLIGMTYERGQNVVGWHRHETDGLVESVATIYGTDDDEVWLVVKRTIDGDVKRYVERFNPVKWEDKEDCFFVDCGVTYNFAPGVAGLLSGLDHLEGKTLAILVDGCVVDDKTVSGGEVTLDEAGTVVQIGLPFETVIKPMRIDTDPQTGNSQGLVKQIRGLTLRLLNTLGLQYGDGKADFETLEFRETDDEMDSSPPLFTGDKEVQFPGEFETEGDIVIKQVQPLPMTLLAIVTRHQITGK